MNLFEDVIDEEVLKSLSIAELKMLLSIFEKDK